MNTARPGSSERSAGALRVGDSDGAEPWDFGDTSPSSFDTPDAGESAAQQRVNPDDDWMLVLLSTDFFMI